MRANLFSTQRTSLGVWLAGLVCSLLLIGYRLCANRIINRERRRLRHTEAIYFWREVTLKNESRNFSLVTTTAADGSFFSRLFPPGTYNLEVEAPGFRRRFKPKFRLWLIIA